MSSVSEAKPVQKHRPKFRLHQSLRWVHTYVSMFSMVVILFFAVTGILLNHPEWTFGMKDRTQTLHGTLSPGFHQGDKIDWLKVAEELRATNHLHGRVQDPRLDGDEGSLSFKGPGYSADCYFKMPSGEYEVTTVDQGLMGLLNDLHRGKDVGKGWSFAVDLSGAFLALLSLTGLGILLYLKKSRTAGLILLGLGVLTVVVVAAVSR